MAFRFNTQRSLGLGLGGGGGTVAAAFNPAVSSTQLAFTNNNRTARNNTGGTAWANGLGQAPKTTGKFSFAMACDAPGANNVAWIGVANSSVDLAASPTSATSTAYRSNGGTTGFGAFAGFGAGDIIRCDVDLDARTIEFFKNGSSVVSNAIQFSGAVYIFTALVDNNAQVTLQSAFTPGGGFAVWPST